MVWHGEWNIASDVIRCDNGCGMTGYDVTLWDIMDCCVANCGVESGVVWVSYRSCVTGSDVNVTCVRSD